MYKVDHYKFHYNSSAITGMNMKISLGIDIAKLSFDIALLVDKIFYCKKFGNSETGFNKFAAWLKAKDIISAHACMEATGKYGLWLAEWLSERDFIVSIVNPASIKGLAQSQLTRNKTDTVDAKLIATFTQALKPEPWIPPSPQVRELRDWVDRCENLKTKYFSTFKKITTIFFGGYFYRLNQTYKACA